MKFLLLDMTASRVNLLMNDYASGLPSPLAFLGLGAAIAPAIGAERWSVGVLPVIHDIAIASGRTKPEMVPASGRFSPLETVEDMVGTVRFSIILDVRGCDDETAVREALVGRRLAGGTFQGPKPDVTTVAGHGASLSLVPRGWALIRPDDPKRHAVSRGDAYSLSAVAEILFPTERGLGFGWPVPVAVGHYLLEDPVSVPERRGTRDRNIPHIFTEPILGIGELVSVRNKQLTETTEETFDDLFWRWHAEGSWVLGHRSYYPHNRFT